MSRATNLVGCPSVVSERLAHHGIYWRSVLASLLALPIVPTGVRNRVLDLVCDGVHPTARLYHGTHFLGARLRIDERAFINSHCVIDANASVVIGPDVHLGRGVQIVTLSHEVGPSRRRAGARAGKPVMIGAGSWLGAGAVVLPGVTVGEGCIVGAGAVVREDCEPHGLYAGVPAVRRRDLPSDVLDAHPAPPS
jgi:maltose O-acetyltransferase